MWLFLPLLFPPSRRLYPVPSRGIQHYVRVFEVVTHVLLSNSICKAFSYHAYTAPAWAQRRRKGPLRRARVHPAYPTIQYRALSPPAGIYLKLALDSIYNNRVPYVSASSPKQARCAINTSSGGPIHPFIRFGMICSREKGSGFRAKVFLKLGPTFPLPAPSPWVHL